MFILKIDRELCVNCLLCEVVLPGLLTRAKDGWLSISPANLAANRIRIDQAITRCKEGALALEEQSHDK